MEDLSLFKKNPDLSKSKHQLFQPLCTQSYENSNFTKKNSAEILDAHETCVAIIDIDRLGMHLPLYRPLDSSIFLDTLLNIKYI